MIQNLGMQMQSQENTTITKCRRCQKQADILKVRDNFRKIDMEFADLEEGYCKDCIVIKREEDKKKASERFWVERKERVIEMLGGPRFYDEFTFNRFIPQRDKDAYEKAISFNPYKQNLVFEGPTGTGKTHLAVAIARKFADKNFEVRVLKAYELSDFILKNESQREQIEARNFLGRLPILVVDDLGVGSLTDYAKRIFYEVMERRWAEKLNGLIVTTNMPLNDVARTMGDRIASRIAGWFDIVKMKTDDNRLNRNG